MCLVLTSSFFILKRGSREKSKKKRFLFHRAPGPPAAPNLFQETECPQAELGERQAGNEADPQNHQEGRQIETATWPSRAMEPWGPGALENVIWSQIMAAMSTCLECQNAWNNTSQKLQIECLLGICLVGITCRNYVFADVLMYLLKAKITRKKGETRTMRSRLGLQSARSYRHVERFCN